YEVELADHGERTELLADRRDQLFAELLRRLATLLENDERGDDLPSQGVGAARDAGLGDGRVPKEGGLDLDRSYSMVGDLDDLVGATREPHVAVLVDRRGIAGEIHGLARHLLPVILRVALGLRPQPRGQAGERPLDDEDAFLARRELAALLIDHRGLDAGERDSAW